MTLRINCSRNPLDTFRVNLGNAAHVYITIDGEDRVDGSASALLEDRAQVETLRNALSLWLGGDGPPRQKLEIEGSPSDGYDAWFTDSDGNLNTVVCFANPMATADWCERNGFAWEVIGLEGDPAQWLADWRAQQ